MQSYSFFFIFTNFYTQKCKNSIFCTTKITKSAHTTRKIAHTLFRTCDSSRSLVNSLINYYGTGFLSSGTPLFFEEIIHGYLLVDTAGIGVGFHSVRSYHDRHNGMTSARLGSESTATVADFHIFVLVQCKLMEAIFHFADIDDSVGSLQEQINRAELMIFLLNSAHLMR